MIAAIAYLLPVTTIAEMLRVRPRDMDRFEQGSHAQVLSVGQLVGRYHIQRIKSLPSKHTSYFESIIDKRRRVPREDSVSGLLAVERKRPAHP